MTTPSLVQTVCEIFEKCREALELDRWGISVGTEKFEIAYAKASNESAPEYRLAKIAFDPERLETGDDLQEITVHEMAHCHTWELHTLAEELADALAESAPRTHRKALRKLLREKVRQAGERCTTDVGHVYLRLLRRSGILDTPDQGS